MFTGFTAASYLSDALMAMLSVIMESNQACVAWLSWTLHRMSYCFPPLLVSQLRVQFKVVLKCHSAGLLCSLVTLNLCTCVIIILGTGGLMVMGVTINYEFILEELLVLSKKVQYWGALVLWIHPLVVERQSFFSMLVHAVWERLLLTWSGHF